MRVAHDAFLPDDVLKETAEAFERLSRNQTATAKELGIARSTLQHRLVHAARAGYVLPIPSPVAPGFEVAEHSVRYDARGGIQGQTIKTRQERIVAPTMLPGHVVKGTSTYVDGSGRTIGQWIKTRETALDPTMVAQWLREAYSGLPARARSEPPRSAAQLIS